MKNKTLRFLAILLPVLTIVMVILLLLLRSMHDDNTSYDMAETEDVMSEASEISETVPDTQTYAASSETEITSEAENTETTEVSTETETVTDKDTVLVFAGDILLGDRTLPLYQSSGIDGILSPDLLNLMQNADICMVNEEFPFSTRGEQAPDKQFTFRTDPIYVSAFTDMGIDIVTLANNHVLDYGTEALLDTFDTLDSAGIPYVGAGENAERAKKPHYIEANGLTFGFLAASRVWPVASWEATDTNPGCFGTYDPAKLIEAIKEARDDCDFLTVYVHWGIERQNYPEDYQVNMAQMYIDAGADLVIGSHPHCLQGIEYFNGKPVFYSLGNYIFGQTTDKTAAIKVTVDKDCVPVYEVVPATAQNSKTYMTEGDTAQSLFSYMNEISYDVFVDNNGVVSNRK